MEEIPLMISSTLVHLERFWTSVSIYYDRPHLINRKLAAISPILFCEISINSSKIKNLHEIFTWQSLIYEIRKISDYKTINLDFIKSITENYDKDAKIEASDWTKFEQSYDANFISVRALISRLSSKTCIEIVIFDKSKNNVAFFAVQEQDDQMVAPKFPYHIKLSKDGSLRINLNNFEDAESKSAEWLADKLFPKLIKWAENELEAPIIKSLSLIPADEYFILYHNLKTKYGDPLVKKWHQKVKTDPYKYVYEDIAIASYLIILWRQLKSEKINFVDCGCGNGLLVYILNKEGYKGCGLDVRRRQVWDLYENEADLRIETILPESTFPEATWLIGNHSDELTVWLPIIGLNSSPQTNFFVLPCCSYDLNGEKYLRLNGNVSQYADFLNYVEKISNLCGFETSVDKLRIPSTKRICFVGVRKNTELKKIKSQVDEFIAERLKSEFVARKSIETVRNCTNLDKNLIKKMVQKTVDELLKEKNYIKYDNKNWNKGGNFNVGELCKKFSQEDLQSLKNNCGGFQTLLKNHRYIFNVKRGGVTLQKPISLKETEKYKDKPCWYQKNHPDGCIFTSETCGYKHE